jgi:putative endonuclease
MWQHGGRLGMTDGAERSIASWSVYLVRCSDNSLYTGIATDVVRRFAEHQAQGPKTARYLRGRAPLTLVFQCPVSDRSAALRLEYRIKQLPKVDKLRLIAGDPPLLVRLQTVAEPSNVY